MAANINNAHWERVIQYLGEESFSILRTSLGDDGVDIDDFVEIMMEEISKLNPKLSYEKQHREHRQSIAGGQTKKKSFSFSSMQAFQAAMERDGSFNPGSGSDATATGAKVSASAAAAVAGQITFTREEIEKEKKEMEETLRSLFSEIDVNNNGDVSWEEFTHNLLHSIQTEANEGTEISAHIDFIFQGMLPLLTTKQRSSSFGYHPAWERYLLVETIQGVVDRGRLSVFRSQPVSTVGQSSVGLHGVHESNFPVEGYAFVDPLQMLATTTTNSKLQYLTMTEDPMLEESGQLQRLSVRREQHLDGRYPVLRWDNETQLLFGGSSEGKVSFIDPLETTMVLPQIVHQYQPYDGPIVDLCVLPERGNKKLLTSGNDGKLLGYDVHRCENLGEIGDRIGATSMSFCSEYSMLVTISPHELDPLVWSPHNLANAFVKRLQDEQAKRSKLVQVQCLPNSPYCVSADVTGLLKVWDLRKLNMVVSFYSDGDREKGDDAIPIFCKNIAIEPSKFEVVSSCRAEVGNCLFSFRATQSASRNPVTSHDDDLVSCVYLPQMEYFITAAPDSLKVWDAKAGKVLQHLKSFFQEDDTKAVSCMACDPTARRFYLGTMQGSVTMHSMSTCGQLGEMPPHNSAVLSLRLIESRMVIVAVSADGCVHATATDGDEPVPLFKTKLEDAITGEVPPQTTCFALSEKMSLVVKGDVHATIQQLDLAPGGKGVLVGRTNAFKDPQVLQATAQPGNDADVVMYMNPDVYEATCCLVCEPFAFTITGNTKGYLEMVAIRPHPQSGTMFARWKTFYPRSTSTVFSVAHSLAFDPDTRTLFVGDDQGNVTVWDLSEVIERFSFVPCEYPAPATSIMRLPHSKVPAGTLQPKLKGFFVVHTKNVPVKALLWVAATRTIAATTEWTVSLWSTTGLYMGSLMQGRDTSVNSRCERWMYGEMVEAGLSCEEFAASEEGQRGPGGFGDSMEASRTMTNAMENSFLGMLDRNTLNPEFAGFQGSSSQAGDLMENSTTNPAGASKSPFARSLNSTFNALGAASSDEASSSATAVGGVTLLDSAHLGVASPPAKSVSRKSGGSRNRNSSVHSDDGSSTTIAGGDSTLGTPQTTARGAASGMTPLSPSLVHPGSSTSPTKSRWSLSASPAHHTSAPHQHAHLKWLTFGAQDSTNSIIRRLVATREAIAVIPEKVAKLLSDPKAANAVFEAAGVAGGYQANDSRRMTTLELQPSVDAMPATPPTTPTKIRNVQNKYPTRLPSQPVNKSGDLMMGTLIDPHVNERFHERLEKKFKDMSEDERRRHTSPIRRRAGGAGGAGGGAYDNDFSYASASQSMSMGFSKTRSAHKLGRSRGVSPPSTQEGSPVEDRSPGGQQQPQSLHETQSTTINIASNTSGGDGGGTLVGEQSTMMNANLTLANNAAAAYLRRRRELKGIPAYIIEDDLGDDDDALDLDNPTAVEDRVRFHVANGIMSKIGQLPQKKNVKDHIVFWRSAAQLNAPNLSAMTNKSDFNSNINWTTLLKVGEIGVENLSHRILDEVVNFEPFECSAPTSSHEEKERPSTAMLTSIFNPGSRSTSPLLGRSPENMGLLSTTRPSSLDLTGAANRNKSPPQAERSSRPVSPARSGGSVSPTRASSRSPQRLSSSASTRSAQMTEFAAQNRTEANKHAHKRVLERKAKAALESAGVGGAVSLQQSRHLAVQHEHEIEEKRAHLLSGESPRRNNKLGLAKTTKELLYSGNFTEILSALPSQGTQAMTALNLPVPDEKITQIKERVAAEAERRMKEDLETKLNSVKHVLLREDNSDDDDEDAFNEEMLSATHRTAHLQSLMVSKSNENNDDYDENGRGKPFQVYRVGAPRRKSKFKAPKQWVTQLVNDQREKERAKQVVVAMTLEGDSPSESPRSLQKTPPPESPTAAKRYQSLALASSPSRAVHHHTSIANEDEEDDMTQLNSLDNALAHFPKSVALRLQQSAVQRTLREKVAKQREEEEAQQQLMLHTASVHDDSPSKAPTRLSPVRAATAMEETSRFSTRRPPARASTPQTSLHGSAKHLHDDHVSSLRDQSELERPHTSMGFGNTTGQAPPNRGLVSAGGAGKSWDSGKKGIRVSGVLRSTIAPLERKAMVAAVPMHRRKDVLRALPSSKKVPPTPNTFDDDIPLPDMMKNEVMKNKLPRSTSSASTRSPTRMSSASTTAPPVQDIGAEVDSQLMRTGSAHVKSRPQSPLILAHQSAAGKERRRSNLYRRQSGASTIGSASTATPGVRASESGGSDDEVSRPGSRGSVTSISSFSGSNAKPPTATTKRHPTMASRSADNKRHQQSLKSQKSTAAPTATTKKNNSPTISRDGKMTRESHGIGPEDFPSRQAYLQFILQYPRVQETIDTGAFRFV